MPYAQPWSSDVYASIGIAATSADLIAKKGIDMRGDIVLDEIWRGIASARVIVADITGSNPNVCYEIGIGDHHGQEQILISQSTRPEDIPFDLRGRQVLKYNPLDLKQFEERLGKMLLEIRKSHFAGIY